MPIVLMRNGAIYEPEGYLYYGGAIHAIDDSLSSKITSVIKPDNTVVDVPTFVFHCNSVPKTGKLYINQEIDNSGSGSETDPWHDLNYALRYITCLIASTCSYDNYAFIIKLSGTVNYYIGSGLMAFNDASVFDGRGLVTIDCTDAVFRYTALPVCIEILHGVNFLNMDIESSENVKNAASRYPVVIEELFNCRIQFKRIKLAFDAEMITNSTSVVGILNCYNSFFYGDELEVSLAGELQAGNISVAGVNHCSDCYFSVKKTTLDCSKTVYMGTHISAYGFDSTENCILQDCHVTFKGVASHSVGCAFSGTVDTTWLGENIGFILTEDADGNRVLLPNSLINANCEDAPIEPSSSVPPSSSYQPPSSSYQPPSSGEPSSSSDETPSSSSVPPSSGDTSKGYVRETGYQRILDFKTTPNFSDYYGDEACKADYYYSGVSVHEGYSYGFDKLFAKMATVHGEVFEEEDENGEPVYYCELPSGPYYNEETDKIEIYDPETDETREIQLDIKGLIAEIDTILQGVIQGTIHHNTVSPEAVAAFPSDGWTGYRWYRPYHENSWTSTLKKSGQELVYETNSYLGYYDAWGGIPCGSNAQPVDGSITINTSVFEWVPNDDYNGPAPKKVILVDENGNRRAFDFGVEYCPTGLDYAELDWFKVVSCGGGNNEWAVPAGVVTDTGWEKKNKTNRTNFTYDGVLF